MTSVLALVTALALQGAPQTMDSVGRVTISAGTRIIPNSGFIKALSDSGTTVTRKWPVGIGGMASFGYGATDWIEICIDLFLGYEGFSTDTIGNVGSFAYGALMGVRFQKLNIFMPGLLPYAGFSLGPLVSDVTSSTTGLRENLMTTYVGTAGVSYVFLDRFSVGLEYRFMYANATAADYGPINAGGHWIMATFGVLFLTGNDPTPPVPGF